MLLCCYLKPVGKMVPVASVGLAMGRTVKEAHISRKGLQAETMNRWEVVMRKSLVWLVAMLGWAALGSVTFSASGEEFFKGKTIRLIVASSPGGGFDTYSRTIARHIGKHIPGNPAVVVQNMPGAGHLIAANYLYNKAKPDGLTIGNWSGGLVQQQAMKGRPGISFDARKFEYLGVPVSDTPVCALTKGSGIDDLEEWSSGAKVVKLGGSAPGDSMSDHPRVLRAALGLPLRLIDGYGGTAKIRLAAESGEVDGGCWSWNSMKVTWRKAIQSGEARVLIQVSNRKHPDLPDVPNALDLAKDDKARQLIKAGIQASAGIIRLYGLPPGTPPQRVEILRNAFMATMNDPEFLREAQKSGLEIDPKSGREVKEIVDELLNMDPELLANLKKIVTPKN